MRPSFDLAAVEYATAAVLARGHRLLQTHYFAKSDRGQVTFLLSNLEPLRPGALVLDIGCGIGEVARLMAQMAPDLRFLLANISPYQLSLCPHGEPFWPLRSDAHALGLADHGVDAVIFSSALCQMDEATALAEAYRVLKDGGVLLLSEMARLQGDGGAMEQTLGARVLDPGDLLAAVDLAGFRLDYMAFPEGDAAHFRQFLAEDDLEYLLEGVFPVLVRATKGAR